MCEALLWKVARGNWDAGDVIVVVENGHPWTETERNNPDWQILLFPGPGSQLADMVQPDFRSGVLWRQRARHFVNGQKVTKEVSGVIRL